MNFTVRSVLCAALAVFCTGVVAAKDPELKSAWPQAPVKVDGSAAQWAGSLAPLPDDPILVGVRNDADYLYLCLKTSDGRLKAQLAKTGMTVWVNGAGKNKRGYGVRFPAGGALQQVLDENAEPEARPTPGTPATIDDSKVELIGPTDRDRLTVARGDADPVQAALGDDSGVTVIELRFPLKPSENHPLAVEAKPGATIALGLETERVRYVHHRKAGETEAEAEDVPPAPHGGWGDGRDYGGYGGYAAERRARGQGPGEGGAVEMPRWVRLWTRVTLAAVPPAPPAVTPTPHG